MITNLVSLLLRFAHEHGKSPAVARITTYLSDIGLLSSIVDGLKGAHASHQATGPHRPTTKVDGIIETEYFGILARILVSSPEIFASAVLQGSEETAGWLLTEWFSHFENMGTADKKKLNCLALTRLLDLGPQKWVLGRLQEFIGIWTDVIVECIEVGEDGGDGIDTLVWNKPAETEQDWVVGPEDRRKKDVS